MGFGGERDMKGRRDAGLVSITSLLLYTVKKILCAL